MLFNMDKNISKHFLKIINKQFIMSANQPAKSNSELVKQIYGYFGEGNIDGVIGMLADNVNWIIPTIKNYPPSGTHNGKDEVRKFFMSMPEYVEVISFEPKIFSEDGPYVYVQGNYEFKAKSTGKTICCDWVEVFYFDNGKISRYEEYTDTAAFQNAFSK